MSFMIGKVALQPRIDKVDIRDDTSVKAYLHQHREEQLQHMDAKVTLVEIIDKHIKPPLWRKYGSRETLLEIINGILEEICKEEVDLAIHWFKRRGIKKCVTFLLDCVS